jgi:tetratricopeptide (TPR) repeat protein
MASKSRKRSKRRVSVDPLDLIRRNFERGDCKQALKDARVAYRQAPSPELRSLLEHVYMGRADQLSRQGLRDDCRRILQELTELGVTEPSVKAGLPALLLSVGMLDSLESDTAALTDAQRGDLQVKIVDQAVLRPEHTPRGMPEIRQAAERIRAALQAVEAGDEAAALAELRDIPRQSLLADWKFFVRGLIAYYRGDQAEMLANWTRLDENRAAVKITAPLKLLAGVESLRQNPSLLPKVQRLERQVTDHPVLGVLIRLQQPAVDGRWDDVLRVLQRSGRELHKLDTDVYRRVVNWLRGVFVPDGRVKDLERLARVAEPLPTDPRWNWARAAVRDNDEQWAGVRYWQAYLADVDTVTGLTPDERNLTRAMIQVHLAEDVADDARRLRKCRCGADHSLDIEEAEAEALHRFQQSMTLAPRYEPAYVGLMELYMQTDRRHEVAKVCRQWLQQKPDDQVTLVTLSRYHMSCDEPLQARQYAARARDLKPLDKAIGDLLRSTYVASARHFARQGDFDRARQELTDADGLQPGRADAYDTLALKAVLETKAGQTAVARDLIKQAQDGLTDPTAVWLTMAIEATRLELPKEETWLYEKRWQEALKRRCCSQTAGLLCKILDEQLQTEESQEDNQQRVSVLLKYIRRCSRVKWQVEDLRHVCEFLDTAEEHASLIKLVDRSLRKFPEVAYLHWFAAKLESHRRTLTYDRRRCLKHLNEVVRLGGSSEDPRDKELVDQARKALAILEDSPLGHLFDAFEDDDDFDDDDDDFDDDGDGDDEARTDAFLAGLAGIPRQALIMFVRAFCKREGLDPDEVMAELDRRQATRNREGR